MRARCAPTTTERGMSYRRCRPARMRYFFPDTRSQNSPRSLVRGNGSAGTGLSRNAHSGSQPSLT